MTSDRVSAAKASPRAARRRARRIPLSPELELAIAARPKGICPECGEGAITRRGICYECVQSRDGKPTVEFHHVFGRSEAIEIPIPANLHKAIHDIREVRLPVLKEPHCGDPVIRAAQTLVTAAELSQVLCRRALDRNYPVLADVSEVGARCRRAALWLLALHHWRAFKSSKGAIAECSADVCAGEPAPIQLSEPGGPSLVGIAALCSSVVRQRTYLMLDVADRWAAPAAQLENAIANRLREDSLRLLEINHQLSCLYGSHWHQDQSLPKWLI